MPKRTNEFQQLVHLIQEQLKDRPDAVVTESKMLVDRNTGKRREADIVIECKANGINLIIAFECRDRSRKPTIEWVEQMIKKHEHLSDKLILVANRSFSADAIDLAKREGAETVELSEATKTNWPAIISQYTELLFSTFDFQVQSFSFEYSVPPDGPRFPEGQMVRLTDMWGKGCALDEAVRSLVSNHELFGKNVMELWYRRSLKERRSDHTVTTQYIPPADQPMTVSQGALAYPLTKLTFTVGAKIGQAAITMGHAGYKGVRVAHGSATLEDGSLTGQSVLFVMTEGQGQRPKGAVRLSAAAGGKPLVRVVDLEAGGSAGNTEDLDSKH